MAVLQFVAPILPGKFDNWKEFHDSLVNGGKNEEAFKAQMRVADYLAIIPLLWSPFPPTRLRFNGSVTPGNGQPGRRVESGAYRPCCSSFWSSPWGCASTA